MTGSIVSLLMIGFNCEASRLIPSAFHLKEFGSSISAANCNSCIQMGAEKNIVKCAADMAHSEPCMPSRSPQGAKGARFGGDPATRKNNGGTPAPKARIRTAARCAFAAQRRLWAGATSRSVHVAEVRSRVWLCVELSVTGMGI